MAHWLGWAYLLEFQGRPVHLFVWIASLAFFAAHVWVACELAIAWRWKEAAQGGGGSPGDGAALSRPKTE
jgi:hypothetical protein